MDALRKAEQQKQKAAQEGRQAPDALPDPLALEPLPGSSEAAATLPAMSTGGPDEPGARPGSGRLPELPPRLEDLDEQFMAHAAEANSAQSPFLRAASAPMTVAPAAGETRTGAPADTAPAKPMAAERLGTADASRETARKLFEAKQPRERSNRSFAIAVGLLTLIAAVGIGGYFWWQLQPRNTLIAAGPAAHPVPAPPAAPVAPASAPAPQVPAATPAPPVAATPPAAPTPPVTAAAPAASAVPPAPTFQPTPVATKPAAAPAVPAPARSEKPAAPARPAVAPEAPIRITAAQNKPNLLLEQAYQAYTAGELDRADAAWQKVLQADPRNADALHGLGAIAQQRRQPERAANYYLRAIEVDPKDALALSALTTLKGTTEPQQTESRLKNLLAEQPDSPYLNFALGNLYAGNARWADAQQAFFKAYVADPGHPDYLFNLAVSLDQLHQTRLAAQYYNQALTAAAQRPASFDTVQAAVRLKALQP